MNYPIRVINNKIKHKLYPSLDINLGEFIRAPGKAKNIAFFDIILIIALISLIAVTLVTAFFIIGAPFIDIIHRENNIAQEIREINIDTPDVTLTQLFEQYNITVTHRANIGETQAVITVAGDSPLSLLLYITSQVPGIFSIQYSQDGFQIFIAGGSV